MAITVITPASSQKLTTVADVKEVLGITVATDDVLIGKMIDRVSRAIETFTRRFFAQQTISETLSMLDVTQFMLLSRFPIVTVTEIKLLTEVIDPTTFSVDEPKQGKIFKKDFWTTTGNRFDYTVTYTHGFVLSSFGAGTPDLPLDIEQAAIQAVKEVFQSRQREVSLKGESVPDVYAATYGEGSSANISSGLSSDVKDMLKPYIHYNI